VAIKPESRLQRRIQHALRKAFPGCYVRKIWVGEYQTGGIADLICCIEGFFFAIEVKLGNKKRTALQRFEADEVERAVGVSFVGFSPEQVVIKVKRALARKHRETKDTQNDTVSK
jgi:hypothetical protein